MILTNDSNKKKKDKRKRIEKKTKEVTEKQKKRRRSERTPPPSKEVFASGDNILVSVSFNKDTENRDVTTTKRKREVQETVTATKKVRKEKRVKTKRINKDLTGVKPVAIIDLDRSPFKELTPSPKDIIVLSDSDNAEGNDLLGLQKAMCDSSQQVRVFSVQKITIPIGNRDSYLLPWTLEKSPTFAHVPHNICNFTNRLQVPNTR